MKIKDEKSVALLWRSGRLSSFTDDMGNEIKVICAGRESTRPGCDFQDVVLYANGKRITGDVEVHLTSDLWKKHGHQENPAYNGVILHVVMWQKGELPVRLQTGEPLPTVLLSSYVSLSDLKQWRMNSGPQCSQIGRRSPASLRAILLTAGMRRFQTKAVRYAGALRERQAEQVLYEGICRALGYSRNTRPFEAIAEGLSAGEIVRLASGSESAKRAVILGMAGLLPSQAPGLKPEFPGEEIERMEDAWLALPKRPPLLSVRDWCFSGVRPGNHPLRRLAYLGSLLHKYEEGGLTGAFTGAVQSAAPGEETRLLEEVLIMPGLMGRGRAREIVVNHLLPFAMSYAVHTGDVHLASKVIYVYLNCGRLPDNELLRYMKALLLLEGLKGWNACLQQGLLHIYHSFCRAKDCVRCPVSICRKTAREPHPASHRPSDLT